MIFCSHRRPVRRCQ